MSRIEEHLALFHSKNIYIPTKTLLLTGEVGEDMFNEFIKNIHVLDSMEGGITVKIMSEGGCLTTARAIYDVIKGCKHVVRGICYGEVSSSATIILQAFDERIMTPNSKLMIHVGSESVPQDHPKNVESLFKNHRDDQEWMENIYLYRIKEKKKRFTREKLQDILIFDKYMSAKECLDLGLIDSIGEVQ